MKTLLTFAGLFVLISAIWLKQRLEPMIGVEVHRNSTTATNVERYVSR